MPCFHPFIGQQRPEGGRVAFSNLDYSRDLMTVPCGKCIGCRIDRSRGWAIRILAEAQTAGVGRSWFVTNTYAPEFNPITLQPRDHTLFLKKLRNHYSDQKVRFYLGAEYGDQKHPVTGFGRPHFHYALFGLDLPDLEPFGGSEKNPLFVSPTLSRLWGKGHVTIGSVTYESASYIAAYIHKKRLGKDAGKFYVVPHPETGEELKMHPEFSRQSLKPGIGAEWFSKFHSDVYPADKFPLKGGSFVKPPKYFDALYERLASDNVSLPPLDSFKEKRRERSVLRADDLTEARLKVREACAIAKAKFYSNRKL